MMHFAREKVPPHIGEGTYAKVKSNLDLVLEKTRSITPGMVFNANCAIKLQKIRNAMEVVHRLLVENVGRKDEVKPVISQVDNIANYATSLLDGLKSLDAGAEDLPPFKQMVRDTVAEIERSVASWLTTPPVLEEFAPAPIRDESFVNADKVIHEYAGYLEKMPRGAAGGRPYLMLKLPVIAIFNNNVSTRALFEAGFNAKALGTYSVMEDQLIVAINTKYVKDKNLDLNKYRDKVFASITSTTKRRWILVDDQIGYRNSGYVYYWLMSEADYDKLRKIGIKSLSVSKWGFAFK